MLGFVSSISIYSSIVIGEMFVDCPVIIEEETCAIMSLRHSAVLSSAREIQRYSPKKFNESRNRLRDTFFR